MGDSLMATATASATAGVAAAAIAEHTTQAGQETTPAGAAGVGAGITAVMMTCVAAVMHRNLAMNGAADHLAAGHPLFTRNAMLHAAGRRARNFLADMAAIGFLFGAGDAFVAANLAGHLSRNALVGGHAASFRSHFADLLANGRRAANGDPAGLPTLHGTRDRRRRAGITAVIGARIAAVVAAMTVTALSHSPAQAAAERLERSGHFLTNPMTLVDFFGLHDGHLLVGIVRLHDGARLFAWYAIVNRTRHILPNGFAFVVGDRASLGHGDGFVTKALDLLLLVDRFIGRTFYFVSLGDPLGDGNGSHGRSGGSVLRSGNGFAALLVALIAATFPGRFLRESWNCHEGGESAC